MKLYAGTTEQFRTDAQMHRIAEELRAEYTTQIGHRPAPSEVGAWQNSLMALSMLVDQAELNAQGVILEYQLGNTSRRLDAMLTGQSPTSAERAVVVELMQWNNGASVRRPRTTAAPHKSASRSGARVQSHDRARSCWRALVGRQHHPVHGGRIHRPDGPQGVSRQSRLSAVQ